MLAIPTVPIDQVQGLEQHALASVLLITFGVVGTLWGALATVVWWSARAQRNLFRESHRREREISQKLDRDLDAARDETAQVRREHMQDLVKLALVTEGVVRLRDELEEKKQRKAKP